MLLAIDTGNTNTTLGVFEENNLVATWDLSSDPRRTADEYASLILSLLQHRGLQPSDIRQVALCSVVPALVTTFEKLIPQYFKVEPLIVGAGTKTGVRIRMDNPREVGPDRIVNAAAAHHLWGGPIIIIDMGTATTFDTVSREGDYIGGAIAPGIGTAADALVTRTAVLPRVELTRPKKAIGTNTISAMQSGIIFGYVGLVEGIVARIQQELGEKAKVVLTGGPGHLIAKETDIIDELSPDLTLIGLRLIYFMNRT